ncbi:Clp protease N-terminal domain-containing protein [Micromonospora sp. NPDC050397]|uniref:Clp protease N-terminal domain-containing protein n=1 Tax=Micromonospora sp. NPDC050397 TaxID=3364279 RepID=UPI00384CB552
MFERFTDRARRIVVLAQEEARLDRHRSIDVDHVMVACLLEGEGVAARALMAFGLGWQELRQRLLMSKPADLAEPPDGHIPFTVEMRKSLEYSLREALALQHNYIGTEHILLGMLNDGGNSGVKLLGQFGISTFMIRNEVVAQLAGKTTVPTTVAVPNAGSQVRVSREHEFDSRRVREDARERRVLVICGNDEQARDAIFGFLRALDLRPMEQEEIVRGAGSAAPYLGDAVRLAFDKVQAVVALLTVDEVAYLHPGLRDGKNPARDGRLFGQPNPRVLFETGMAFGVIPERTIIVEVGALRAVPNLTGRDVIRIGDQPERQLNRIAERLKSAGCAVNESGGDWLRGGRFTRLAALGRRPTKPGPSSAPGTSPSRKGA